MHFQSENDADVRLGDAQPHLQILQTKFHKSRIVPIHATVVAALSGYLEERRAHERDTWGDRPFVNRDGRPLDVHDLGRWFASLCQSFGIEPANTHDRRPCLTSFAIRLQCGACASGTARVWTCNRYCRRWRSILVMLGRKAPTGTSPPRRTS
jgi:integrase/recombinase XerD